MRRSLAVPPDVTDPTLMRDLVAAAAAAMSVNEKAQATSALGP
jgi:hypothetical protein